MTTNPTRAMRPAKLLFEVTIDRRKYWRRFRFLLIILLMAVLAWFALPRAAARAAVDPRVLAVGQLAAAVIILLASVRGLINLIRWRSRPNETLRFFNKGFTWERAGDTAKYSWNRLQTFREGGRGLYIGKQPLVQWGVHTLVMADKRTFKLRPRHGDLRQMARAIRPYAAEVTGTYMGRRLRQDKPVRLHPRLVAWPGGLQVGKQEYPWGALNVAVERGSLVIRAKDNGKVRTVRRFDTHTIDNLGGFMELATTTIRNHRQRST